MPFTGWLPPPTILVVEDEPLIAMDLEGMLSDAGCIVIGPTATIGEALDLAASHTIDCAVLDVQLKDGSSVEVARLLLERDVPFIVTTGLREADIEDAVLRPATVLIKPIDQRQLLGEIRRLTLARPHRRDGEAGPTDALPA